MIILPTRRSRVKAKQIAHERRECRQAVFWGLIKCQVHNETPYKNLYSISGVKKRIWCVIKISFFTMYIIKVLKSTKQYQKVLKSTKKYSKTLESSKLRQYQKICLCTVFCQNNEFVDNQTLYLFKQFEFCNKIITKIVC